MIRGTVSISPIRQAQIEIRLRGPNGTQVSVEAIVDTGFTEFLTLPLAVIQSLNLPFIEATRSKLADGKYEDVAEYEGRIWWDQWRTIQIIASEGDILLGMAMMVNHNLTVEIVPSGEVTIEPIEP